MLDVSPHLSGRLIRLIESHADKLTRETVRKLQRSARTPSYARLDDPQLFCRVNEVYENLGRWLWEKSDEAVQKWFNGLGEQRFREGIALSEVLWALVLTKSSLVGYLDACAIADSAIELYRKQELDRLVGQFFDRAGCYAAEGYEREANSERSVVPAR